MSMIIPHLRLAVLSLFLVLASLFVPQTADTKEEYRETSLGYPLHFVYQNNTGYLGVSEMYPRTYLFSNPHEIATDFVGIHFLVSWLIAFAVLEGLWFLSQKSAQKHARIVFACSILAVSVASVVLLNTYEEKRKQQEEAQQQARLTTIANDAFGITVRYDEQLLTVESNTESSLHFSSPLGRIDIQQIPSTDSFLELLSPDDEHPLQGFMLLERFDQQGLTGYKRWDMPTSREDSLRFLYRFHRGDSLLEITATSTAIDPESGDFETFETIADMLVRSIAFADATDVPNRVIPKTWSAEINPRSVVDTIPLSRMMYVNTDSTMRSFGFAPVTNGELGVTLSYDPQTFRVTENSTDQTQGMPTIELRAKDLRVTITSTTPDQFTPLEKQIGPLPLERVMLIARNDRAGFSGYRRWDWIVQNERPSSMMTYHFHRGTDVLEIQGWIDVADPTSAEFLDAEMALDLLMQNLRFDGYNETELGVVQKDVSPSVSENMMFTK